MLEKNNKHATRHIVFDAESECTMEFIEKKNSYIALNIQSEVRYSDGTHRYK